MESTPPCSPRPATRQARHLRVPVLPEEERAIKQHAAAAGLPVATYLRSIALGAPVPCLLDHQRVEALARIHGELGQLAALLQHGRRPPLSAQDAATLHAIVQHILATQDTMQQVMQFLLFPRTSP